MKVMLERESECNFCMGYIWAKPRDREKYEKSDSRVGESATFGENGRFALDIRQKKKGGDICWRWQHSLRGNAHAAAAVKF